MTFRKKTKGKAKRFSLEQGREIAFCVEQGRLQGNPSHARVGRGNDDQDLSFIWTGVSKQIFDIVAARYRGSESNGNLFI